MINELKIYVKEQVESYIKKSEGYIVNVIELDENNSTFDFIDKPAFPSLEWEYNLFVEALVPIGIRKQNTRTNLDIVTENYRKAIATQYAKNIRIDIDNEDLPVQLIGINRFIRTWDKKAYYFSISLKYRHVETY